MGIDRTVTFPGDTPSWASVAALLVQRNYPVQMRMIDGELAFPDEAPPEGWKEIRVNTAGGMITLRKQGSAITFVTWGNADAAMRQAWNALAWACAVVGGGSVQGEAGPQEPAAFAAQAEMPPGLRVAG